jgi:hypothetical protein
MAWFSVRPRSISTFSSAPKACTSALVVTLSWVASKIADASFSALARSMPASSVAFDRQAGRS